jgi:hypothetical protein
VTGWGQPVARRKHWKSETAMAPLAAGVRAAFSMGPRSGMEQGYGLGEGPRKGPRKGRHAFLCLFQLLKALAHLLAVPQFDTTRNLSAELFVDALPKTGTRGDDAL